VAMDFSVQSGHGAYPTSYSMGRQPGGEDEHSLPSRPRAKSEWSYTSCSLDLPSWHGQRQFL